MTGQTSGMPPVPDDVLNRMTPEQRAKVEAVMQARGGSKATVTKNCVTGFEYGTTPDGGTTLVKIGIAPNPSTTPTAAPTTLKSSSGYARLM